ncbi:MAG: hypothetical protein ACJ71W_21935 [Terriglobales bacterium]
MKSQPVKICTLFQQTFDRATGELISQTDLYFQVRSLLIGNCGHRHRTEMAAMPCLLRMRAQWKQKRYPKRKAS